MHHEAEARLREVAVAIRAALVVATLGWATAKDEGETEPTDDNTNTGGGDAPTGELEG